MSEPIIRNERGCPCGGDCCNEPSVVHGHDCDENCESFCEDVYRAECLSCGGVCYCDL